MQPIPYDKTLVVNLFAGPGAGKSTLAAEVFGKLKRRNINCELVGEYAKQKVWEESFRVLGFQPQVFGKQTGAILRLLGQVDIVVTDSPILLSVVYGKSEPEEFSAAVGAYFKRQWSLNVFVNRVKPYNPKGRMQTEDEAKEVDIRVKSLLQDNGIDFLEVVGDERAQVTVAGLAQIIADTRRGQEVVDAWCEGMDLCRIAKLVGATERVFGDVAKAEWIQSQLDAANKQYDEKMSNQTW